MSEQRALRLFNLRSQVEDKRSIKRRRKLRILVDRGCDNVEIFDRRLHLTI
jgi:hypothetical protein